MPINELKDFDDVDWGKLVPNFDHGGTIYICTKCRTSKCRDLLVKYWYDCHTRKSPLESLGYMEICSLRLVCPFLTIVLINSSVGISKGQAILLPVDVAERQERLLPLPSSTPMILAVCQNSVESIGRTYSFDYEKVRFCLSWLKKNNILFKDVYLANVNVRIDSVEEERVKIDIVDSRILLDRMPLTVEELFAPLRSFEHVQSEPVQIFRNSNEAKTFPHLFPEGKGTFEDLLSDWELSSKNYCQLALKSPIVKFEKDHAWIPIMYQSIQKSDLFRSINYFSKDVEKDKTFTIEEILKYHYPKVGKCVRGSPEYYKSARMKVDAMISQYGPPFIFLTLNIKFLPQFVRSIPKKDEKLPFMELCEKYPAKLAIIFHQEIANLKKTLMNKEELAFSPYIPQNVFIKIEFQRSGYPHAHCLIWMSNSPNLETQEGKMEAMEWYDKFVTTDCTSTDTDMQELIDNYQFHRCSPTCFRKPKETSTIKKPKLSEGSGIILENNVTEPNMQLSHEEMELFNSKIKHVRKNCRFGFPHLLSFTTRERNVTDGLICQGDREIILKRITKKSANINPYNAEFLKLFRSNVDIQIVWNPKVTSSYLAKYVTKAERFDTSSLGDLKKPFSGSENFKKCLSQIGNRYLSGREVGKVEMAWILLGFPLYYSNASNRHLHVDLPWQRERQLKQNPINEKGDYTYGNSIFDYYVNRPSHPIFESMTFVEYFTWFQPSYSNNIAIMEELDDDEDQTNLYTTREIRENSLWRSNDKEGPFLYIQNKAPEFVNKISIKIRQRKTPKCLTASSGKSQISRLYSILLLCCPFRDEKESFGSEFTEQTLFSLINRHLNDIQNNSRYYPRNIRSFIDSELRLASIIRTGNSSVVNWITEMEDFRDDSYNERNSNTLTQLELMNSSDQYDKQCFLQLNGEQKKIVDEILQYFQGRLFIHDSNEDTAPLLVVHGAGGTGKSILIRGIRHAVKTIIAQFPHIFANVDPHKSVLTCAPTGIASSNIDGVTYHSMFSLLSTRSNTDIAVSLRRSIGTAQLLIIDEMSMVTEDHLEMINQRLNWAKNCTNEKMFGNIPVVLVGDFLQAAPVNNPYLFEGENTIYKRLFQPFCLTQSMRQSGDASFANFLLSLRHGEITALEIEMLKDRNVDLFLNEYKENFQESTHLCFTNLHCEEFNEKCITQISHRNGTPVFSVRCRDVYDHRSSSNQEFIKDQLDYGDNHGCHFREFGFPKATDDLSKSSSQLENVPPKFLKLFVGMKVMVTRNISCAEHAVNGALGKVARIVWEYDGAETAHLLNTNSNSEICFPLPRFVEIEIEKTGKNFRIVPHVHYARINQNKTILRYYIPLVPAYGLTIHKCQSLTLDKGVIWLKDSQVKKTPGLIYVALSRFRTWSAFMIKGLVLDMISVSGKALEEEQRLMNKCK